MRTYDIVNAGPNNRFMASGKIVSNSGKLVQLQNLPQNKLADLALARELLREGDAESIEMLFGDVAGTLSQLVRTALIPSTGEFIVCDFSAIEARVIAWLAGESWRMDVFNTHGKIYEASASKMFHVPIESIAKGRENYGLRQKGKIAELALGYQGSVGALEAMGALKMGLTEDELPGIVKRWRTANPAIVQLWKDCDVAAIRAVTKRTKAAVHHGIEFDGTDPRWLFARLPSGRRLAYFKPEMRRDERFDRMALTYEGTEQGKKVWGRLNTHGGKLVENLVQAIARDCLAESLIRIDAAGGRTVFHVHDELIAEATPGVTLELVQQLMGERPTWAPDLPLRGDGYVCPWYRKD